MAAKTNYVKNGNQYYRVTATIGKDADGKAIRKEFYGKSKKEAESKKEEYLKGIHAGLNTDYREMSLGDFMRIWLFEVVKVYAAHSTFDRYEQIYRCYIKTSELSSTKIYNIKPLTLQKYYNELHENKKTSATIFNLNRLLKTFFNYAIKEGYLLTNPCFKAVIPSDSTAEDIKNKNVDPFSESEIKAISNTAEGDLLMIFLLDLGTGLRKGELLGLTAKDIDLENKELHVTKSLKKIRIVHKNGSYEYKVVVEPPKTKNSIRTVPIPSSLIIPLKKHIVKQKEKFLSNGLRFNEDSFIFTTKGCNVLDGRNISTAWERLLNKTNIKYRKFHNIRHTYATQLFESGVNMKTVSTLLGHANISITADTYTHVMPKEKINAVDKLNHLFSSKTFVGK